jgi:hypothetical protein
MTDGTGTYAKREISSRPFRTGPVLNSRKDGYSQKLRVFEKELTCNRLISIDFGRTPRKNGLFNPLRELFGPDARLKFD